VHGGVVLPHLLYQRLHGGLLFFPDCLDLAALIAGQIELFEHVMKVAAAATKSVRTLRNRGCHSQQNSGADRQNANTSRFHWNSFTSVWISEGSSGAPEHLCQ